MTPRDRRIWAALIGVPTAYETYTIVRGEGALSDVLRWAGHTHTRTGKAATWVVIAATAFWLGWHLTAGVADVIDALDGLHDVEGEAADRIARRLMQLDADFLSRIVDTEGDA